MTILWYYLLAFDGSNRALIEGSYYDKNSIAPVDFILLFSLFCSYYSSHSRFLAVLCCPSSFRLYTLCLLVLQFSVRVLDMLL